MQAVAKAVILVDGMIRVNKLTQLEGPQKAGEFGENGEFGESGDFDEVSQGCCTVIFRELF